MNLILKIVNNPKENIISQSHEFKKEGGSIGRDPSCAWVLNDSSEELSRIHANIEYKGGEYYLIDVSSNGMLYKLSNHLVPKGELVKLKESEVLCMGVYEILVGFVKGEDKKSYISDLLNQREMDVAVEEKMLLNKEGNAALDVIMPKESKEKDILEYARGGINRATEIDFSDAFDEEIVVENLVYSSHITAPSFVEELEVELKSSNSSDTLLVTVLSSRLGINIEALSPTRQIELMNELADGLLVALEHKERLEQNAKEIASKLEKPTLKLSSTKSKTGKSLLSEMVFNEKESNLNLSQKLKDGFESIQQQHTALYEASREQSQSLEREFAPENLVKSFESQRGFFSLMGRDTENWRAYVTRYHKLNPSNSNPKEDFSFRLYVAYQKVLETLRLSRGGE